MTLDKIRFWFQKIPFFHVMFIPCIIRRSRNYLQYAQTCTTTLFYIPAPTCFGSSLPSSGSFWIRLNYMKIQIGLVVYHIMLVKWPVCRSVVVPSVVLLSGEAQLTEPRHCFTFNSNIALCKASYDLCKLLFVSCTMFT
jgi:hypothetical protein